MARGHDSRVQEAGPGRGAGTRDRILAQSLALFNDRGLGRVTTAEIAAACGIREGNLQYHFPRKSGLVEALFAVANGLAPQELGDFADPNLTDARQRRCQHVCRRRRMPAEPQFELDVRISHSFRQTAIAHLQFVLFRFFFTIIFISELFSSLFFTVKRKSSDYFNAARNLVQSQTRCNNI